MTISFFLFLILGLYLENVLPGDYGVRKPWYFCFTTSYWFGSRKSAKISQKDTSSLHDLEENEPFETKDMKKENFEPPSRDLVA